MKERSANTREPARVADSPRQKTQQPQPEVYREKAFPTVKEPARRKAVGWNDESTRTCGTDEYLGYAMVGTPIRKTLGVDPADEAQSQRGHSAFKEALMQNVNGIGVKDSERMWNQNDYLGDIGFNPSRSKKQQALMGADLARKRAGQKTATGMTTKQLEEFAQKPRKGY